MVYRDQAYSEADAFVIKADALYTEEVQSEPLDHLDTLGIISSTLVDAKKVYDKKQINNWDHPKLVELEDSLVSHYPDIQTHAKTLMLELVDRTRLLRTMVEDVKTRPAMAAERSPDEMVKFLSERYNKEITDCCLRTLGNIDVLLMRDTTKYRDMLIQIRSMNTDLYKAIKEDGYIETLQDNIRALDVKS